VSEEAERPGRRGVPLTDADQQHYADVLAQHHAADTLTIGELEQRLEKLYAATTREQAAGVIADLPPLPGQPAKRWWRRGHGEPEKAGPGWLSTNERFRDPSTNRIMRVWVDPADGSRHYLPEDS
jgi:uncharacterized protein DUF1707